MKKFLKNDKDEKGIPKSTFAANALTFTAQNNAISPNFLESKFCGKEHFLYSFNFKEIR